MNWKATLALGLLSAGPVLADQPAGAQAAAPVRISQTQSDAFGLGFALALPALRAQEYIGQVKALDAAGNDKDAKPVIARLADRADALRAAEAQSYGQASQELAALGAPAPLRDWVARATKTMRAPLRMSDEAKPEAESDPPTAKILSVLDEAQSLQADAAANAATLRAWMRLSHGPGAVWASDVGALTAGLHVSLVTHDRKHPPSLAAARLKAAAPTGTPPEILASLSSLAPAGGNLAQLVPAQAPPLSPDVMAEAHDSLLDAFHAGRLLTAQD